MYKAWPQRHTRVHLVHRLSAIRLPASRASRTLCSRLGCIGALVMQRFSLSMMMLAAAFAVLPSIASAQEGPGGLLNPQRDCQTIRTCNFRKGGSYRGCLSSYSCRVCRFVKVACGAGRTCEKMRCGWGGVS